jgi:cytochrome c oxidase subunit 3
MISEQPEVQYDTLERQESTARFGMWVFLGSELLLFAGLLALYAAYRFSYPDDFRAAAEHANVLIGTTNTYVLLTSSLTVALALAAAKAEHRRRALVLLAITIALGIAFDVLKGVEYVQHWHDGFRFGRWYAYAPLPQHGAVLYFTLYYALTGLHALHVTIGVGVLAFMWIRIWSGGVSVRRVTGLELGGLYWHFVDVVWIFLWPLLYLIK